jgi:phosphoribosylformylglycinamidine cyclo-ligase
MVALTAADDADAAVALLVEHEVDAWVAGTVESATTDADRGVVRLVGEHS